MLPGRGRSGAAEAAGKAGGGESGMGSSYDVAVIGAGPGGYPAAIRAAQLGRRVAIIEKEAPGGTCLHRGCIPTKSLLASAERYRQALEAPELGVNVAEVSFDYGRMVARKDEIVKRLAAGVQSLLRANGVEIIAGTAAFESPRCLLVRGGDGAAPRRVEARAVIIASGSVSAMPAFLPRHPRVVESRAFLAMTALPASLIVLGGGVVGCEFACLAAQLGVRVTVVEMLADILPMIDRDVRRVLRRRMEALGIVIRAGAPLEEIEADDRGVRGMFRGESVAGEMLLAAVGRAPETAALCLDRAGIAPDARGQIAVDASCRTAQPLVFAVGDVVSGSVQLAHAATSQGIVAAESAAGLRRRVEEVVPSCIFTTPEIGVAGLTAEQAAAAGRETRVAAFPFAAQGKALAAGTPDGFVKWVAEAGSGRLLGAQAVGAHATELIAEAALAIRNELTAAEVARTIHCHPTLAEAWMEAACALQDACIHAMPAKRR